MYFVDHGGIHYGSFQQSRQPWIVFDAPWLAQWKPADQLAIRDNAELPDPQARSAARAEEFSSMLASSGGISSKAVVNYHVQLEDRQQGRPENPVVCELAGACDKTDVR